MCALTYIVFYTCFVNYYFGYLSEAVTLTYTPNPALENSPVTLTNSHTGLQTDETITRVAWSVKVPNEVLVTKGRILMPACTPLGAIDASLYSFSCGEGYFSWTILNVSKNSDQHVWTSTIATTLTAYERNTTLNVQVPITAVSMTAPTNSTVTINAGDSETFKCRTSGGLPQATIKWFKVTGGTCSQSGTELTSTVSSPSVSVVEGLKQVESTLTFAATSTDNGLRICCTASNVEGMQRVSGTKLLYVRYAPSDPPVIEGYASGSTYSMIENSTESLTCSNTGGNPLATLNWSCFNGQMSSPSEQGSMVKRIVQWTSRRNENARCTCTASHVTRPNQPQSAFVNVIVLYPPSTPLFRVANTDVRSSIRITTDSPQTVECTSSGNPSPATSDFTWRKGTNEMSTHSVLNWQGGVKVSDGGSYTCTVETTMTPSDPSKDAKVATSSSTVEIIVLYPPRLRTLYRINAVEGSMLLIQCQFTAGNPLETTSTIIRTVDGTSWSGDHTIQSIKRADAGLYRCTVENSMDPTGADVQTGRDTADFDINVWYNTSITRFEVSAFPNEKKVTVNESDRFVLVCEVLSNPNSTIRLEQKMSTVLTERSNVLKVEYVLENAACSDAAVYNCSGFNNYTDVERAPSKELQLFVRCSPRPSDSHEHLRRNFTGTVHGNVTLAFMAVAYPPPTFEWQMLNGTSYNKVNGDKYVITSLALFTSLTIVNIQQDDFATYNLKVSNGIQPYLQEPFYLNPQDVPQCPTNFTLLSKSTTMATVQWKREFNGGLRQTFVLVYNKRSNSKYLNTSKPEDKEKELYYTEITDLEAGQLYDVTLYSQNMIGPCIDNKSLEIQTDSEENVDGTNTALIGGVAGGSSAVIIIVAGGLIVILYRRRYAAQTKESQKSLTKGQKLSHIKDKHADSDSDEGIPDEVENPMYESSPIEQQKVADATYAMPKKKEGDVYAAVNKKKKKNEHPANVSMSQDNAAFDIYENNRPTTSKQRHMNKDGLLYADIVFANPPKGQRKLVIHGLDDMTAYAEVDLTKKAAPLLDSDDETNKKS